MRLIIPLSLFFLLIIGSACNKCKKNCKNGDCVEGECICKTGWFGDNCDQETRTKFYGNYTVSHVCDNGFSTSASTISEDPADFLKFKIGNFHDSGLEVMAQITKGDTFSIFEQNLDTMLVRGYGYFKNLRDTVRINYYIFNTQSPDSCIDDYIKN